MSFSHTNTHEFQKYATKLQDESDFSYFCKYDELETVIANPGRPLQSKNGSCFVPIDEIFPDYSK